MSDASLWHLAEGISCHAWNADRSKVALCPNTNEIWIFSGCLQPDVTKWRKEAVLTEVRFDRRDVHGRTNKSHSNH